MMVERLGIEPSTSVLHTDALPTKLSLQMVGEVGFEPTSSPQRE